MSHFNVSTSTPQSPHLVSVKMMSTIVFASCLFAMTSSAPASVSYSAQRQKLMDEDKARALGGGIMLGGGESQVDQLILEVGKL